MKTHIRTWLAVATIPVSASLVSSSSSAAVNDVTGDAILMAPPPSVLPGASFGDTTVIHGFVEQQNLVLLGDLVVDAAPESLPLVIAADTCVTTYLLHYDPIPQSTVRGGIEFNGRILGVLLTQSSLDSSNGTLGNAATTYATAPDCQAPPGNGDCALESNDSIDLQPQHIAVEFHANGPGDRVRVITECEAP